MLGYLPKASYWKANGNRTDMPNGGGWQKGIMEVRDSVDTLKEIWFMLQES